MNQEHQYLELCETVKCKIAVSDIHGVGVRTIRPIKKGERLYVMPAGLNPRWYTLPYASLSKFDLSRPEIKALILDRWPAIINGSPFVSPNFEERLLSFVNHSDTPNYNPKNDTALRDIDTGEEVLEDYKQMPNWEKVFLWLK